MDVENFLYLLTAEGQNALDAASKLEPREEDFLAHFTALSKVFPADLARAALETAILRREAKVKFPQADRMYFTREALEQATSYDVSSYRSERYEGYHPVADLGCSIGGDTIAFAQKAFTTGVDLDPLRIQMAQENLRSLGLAEQSAFLQADLVSLLPIKGKHTALFFDPARRSKGRRIFSVRDYHPPLNIIYTWLKNFPAVGVKISPGVDLDELTEYSAEVEFISLRGELKEAVLWFGPLKTASRRATLLPGPHTIGVDRPPNEEPVLPLSEPLTFLLEPDPSILRAGLVGDLGAILDAAQLDPSIAYLTADSATNNPFVRGYIIEDLLPFHLKLLRAYLLERGV
ncbi:MAG: class I SAM-dependent methyltransferase [Chloroflexi bacterium]|nr:MAG: class I SAM-dependent methyltransferase [Chloroflexota bacterium]